MSDSSLHDAAFPVGQVAVGAIGWRFKGELRITAIVKATFAFTPDGAITRAEPQPIFRDEVQHGRGPARSVRFTSDLVPYRRRADVLFTGHAHAPPGGPVESMNVRFALFDSTHGARFLLDKSLVVRRKGGFQTIPLTYENAYGGIGFPDNPFGEGFPDGEGEPSVLDPADPRRPGCFAPVSLGVIPRRRLLGAAPRPSFERGVAQIPDDLDWDYFQAAPADQRTDFLRGDESILLEGLHPALPRVQVRLPGARGAGRIFGLGGAGVQEGRLLAMHADTLHISGDEQRITLTWRGTFPVASEAVLEAVRIALGVELPGEPEVWPDATTLKRTGAAAPRVAPGPASTETLPLSDSDIEVLSRGGALGGTLALDDRPTEMLPDAPPPEAPPARPARGEVAQTLPVPSGVAARSPALPFQSGPAVMIQERPRAEPAVRRGDAGDTMPIPSRGGAVSPATPFQQPTPEPAPAEEPAPTEEPAAAARAPAPAAEAPFAAEAPAKGASPWAPPPEPEPEPAPRPPPPARPPPKVNIRSKLYGADKKGR